MSEKIVLTEFPKMGVCWEPIEELLEYLKKRPNQTGGLNYTFSEVKNKGLAWSEVNLWKVQLSSNRPVYKIEQLLPFLNLSDNPWIPKKWCVRINKHNMAYLDNFLRERKDEWKGYRNSWCLKETAFFHYPPFKSEAGHSSFEVELGYTEITIDKIIHVLTNNKQNNNTLKFKEDERSDCTAIKVQRPDITVRDTGFSGAIGIRCPKIQIKVGSGYLPD